MTGTVLDDLKVECPQPLELCNRWREGFSVAEEQARHVRVVLPKLTRTGLQPWELQQGSVDGVLVERGNLAAQRWRPTSIASALRRYEVTQQAGSAQLQAEVTHDLGAAGVLVESYSPSRAAEQGHPLLIDGESFESGFSLELDGVPEPIALSRCDGGSDLEPAVQVLRATNGARHLVLLRFLNTRLSMAGSYPVHVTGLRLRFSDDWLPTDVSDFFAHTYAAQHHNWFETSIVDLTQEPRLFHAVFRPLAEGVSDPNVPMPERTAERIVFHGIDGLSEPGWLEVTSRKSDGKQLTERWDVQGQLVRIDDTELTRTAHGSCADPKVFLVGYFQPTGITDSFQLVTCPAAAAPGYSLLAVVPVWFAANPALVGTRFDKGITPYQVSGRAGHRVPLGSFTATFTTADGKSFTQEIVDANGKVVGTYTSEASELSQYTGNRIETLKAAAGDVSMTLARQWAGVGVGKSSIYVPLSFSLTFSGRTVLVDAMDALRYANTHHNWEDSLEARGEGLVLRWRTSFDTGTQHEVQVRTDAGQELVPWTELKQQ